MSNPKPTRINKFLSEIRFYPRRAADKLIDAIPERKLEDIKKHLENKGV